MSSLSLTSLKFSKLPVSGSKEWILCYWLQSSVAFLFVQYSSIPKMELPFMYAPFFTVQG